MGYGDESTKMAKPEQRSNQTTYRDSLPSSNIQFPHTHPSPAQCQPKGRIFPADEDPKMTTQHQASQAHALLGNAPTTDARPRL